jgi:hypothetical protein
VKSAASTPTKYVIAVPAAGVRVDICAALVFAGFAFVNLHWKEKSLAL